STLRIPAMQVVRALRPGVLATGIMIAALAPLLRLSASLPGLALLLSGAALASAIYLLALSFLSRTRRATTVDPGRLRVVMFIQSYYPRIGGAETNLQALIQPLQQCGVEVTMVTRRFAGMSPIDCVEGAPVKRLSAPGGQIRASLSFTLSAVWLLLRQRAAP